LISLVLSPPRAGGVTGRGDKARLRQPKRARLSGLPRLIALIDLERRVRQEAMGEGALRLSPFPSGPYGGEYFKVIFCTLCPP
jgi:hypothetical protein